MRRVVVSIILCITFVITLCNTESYAGTKVISWDLVDVGKHMDWDGTTKYKSYFVSATKVWNGYKKGVIRKDNISRWQDVVISDYYEVSNTAGITYIDGLIRFNTYNMDKLNSKEKKNVCIHELGHALGLAHNTSKDVMFAYVTERTKISKNDKKSYDYAYENLY